MTDLERAAYEAGFRECQRRAAESLEAWRGACLRSGSRMPNMREVQAVLDEQATLIRALAPEPPAPAPEKPHE